ncbi:uncharacterized protein LOC102419707 [Myotis lucifugus]|uniref:uncharacterized protein LOC102419707 n=1 Tax=Myotis lucifugus TaxID=59463 RepID=UPI0003C491C0|nr:uncharacterized protein LOC102419707 [Myotis lucifugus]
MDKKDRNNCNPWSTEYGKVSSETTGTYTQRRKKMSLRFLPTVRFQHSDDLEVGWQLGRPSGRAAKETTAQATTAGGSARACLGLFRSQRAVRGAASALTSRRRGKTKARGCTIAPAAPTTDSSGSPSSLWEEGAGHPAFPLSDFRRLPGQLRREPTAGRYSQNTGSRDRFSKTHSKYPFSLPQMANGSVCRLVFGTSSPAGSRSEMKPEVPPLP